MSKSRLPSSSGGCRAASSAAQGHLPITNISRIMKKALPPGAKVARDAKEAVQECVSTFIAFVTGEASERCQSENRSLVTAADLLWAMATLGYDDYLETLELYLEKYREADREGIPTSSGRPDCDNQLEGCESSCARITNYKRPKSEL